MSLSSLKVENKHLKVTISYQKSLILIKFDFFQEGEIILTAKCTIVFNFEPHVTLSSLLDIGNESCDVATIDLEQSDWLWLEEEVSKKAAVSWEFY